MPIVDLAFALSASAIDANENFRKMKDIVKSMVEMYGSGRIRYSVIVYGENPSVKLKFTDISTDENLISFLDIIPRTSGVPSLQRALAEAKKNFDETPSREKARNVLVVIADKKSGSRPADVRGKAIVLEEAGIKVIPVALGNRADVAEIVLTSADNSSLIIVKNADKPQDIAERILKEASKRGKPLI